MLTEIIKELENKEDGGKFRTWLQDKDHDRLFEPKCLERALLVATRKDSDRIIGMLVEKGAKNLEECLTVATQERKTKARAIFLLIKAAKTGNVEIINRLCEKPGQAKVKDDVEDEGFKEVQEAILSGKVSTSVPIKMACNSGNTHVREQLLMNTNVCKEGCSVKWQGLQLLQLEIAWLRKIAWVRILILSNNGFKRLPNDMGNYLKKVCEVSIPIIPFYTFPLPSLSPQPQYSSLQSLPS